MTTPSKGRRGRAAPPPPPVPAPPAPTNAARPVPQGYATRSRPLLAGPNTRVVGGSRTGPSATEVTRRFYEVTCPPPGEAPPANGEVARREAARLHEIAAAAPRGRPAPIRSDYFGTVEHKALAEYLARILRGESVEGLAQGEAAEPSHVLLQAQVPDGGAGAATVVLRTKGTPEGGSVRLVPGMAEPDAGWREALEAEIAGAMELYDPDQELEVRAGVALRYGEIGALAGDYYETPDSLAREITSKVAEAIRRVTPEHDGTYLLDFHRDVGKYVGLALRNEDHFAPRSWIAYAVHHGEALRLALGARDLEAALVRNAFADHFLEDAFATGHLRTPRKIMPTVRGKLWEGGKAFLMHREENAHGLWLQNGRGLVWRGYGDDRLAVNRVHATLVAHALATSLQRLHAAYRLPADARQALLREIDPWLAAAPPDVVAGTRPDPAKLLPDWLAAFPAGGRDGAPALRDVRGLVPVPLPAEAVPVPGVLANYPPMYTPDGRGRSGTPDHARYFVLARG